MHTSTKARWGPAARTRPEAAVRTATGSGAVYRPRNPTATVLYPIVQHHLETFLARAAEADPLGDGVPFWVENDFRAYLPASSPTDLPGLTATAAAASA